MMAYFLLVLTPLLPSERVLEAEPNLDHSLKSTQQFLESTNTEPISDYFQVLGALSPRTIAKYGKADTSKEPSPKQ